MVLSKTSRVQHDEAMKNQFIGAVLAGTNIQKAGRLFGIKPGTAQGIWDKFCKKRSMENLPRSGCPKKTTDHEDRLIVREALKKRCQPFCKIANAVTADVTTSTVQNILAHEGYHQRVAKKVPYLSMTHKKARMAWARKCRVYTAWDWMKKIWSDECYVYLGNNCG